MEIHIFLEVANLHIWNTDTRRCRPAPSVPDDVISSGTASRRFPVIYEVGRYQPASIPLGILSAELSDPDNVTDGISMLSCVEPVVW